MLLRVDVYPTDWAPPSSAAAPQMQQQQQSQRDLAGGEDTDDNFLQPSQTLYACLASSSESQDAGRVLTVGRKVGDVLLSSDKSVSREHMIVRLASVNKTHQKQQEKDDKETIPPPLLATTPEQIQACQEDKYYHMCVLLKNLGKLGSFLVRPAQQDVSKPESKKTASAKDDDDSATDNDETDDEGEGGTQQGASSNFVLPAAAGISLSTVTQLLLQQHYGTTAGATVRPIAMNEQIVLSDLAQQHGHVIVQIGKQNSTLHISRHSINVLRSGSRQGAAHWKAHDYQLGLLDSKIFDENTNLLVTPERNSSPKQLAAWCRHIPIVTSDYLQALLHERKSPADPLFPDPSQYVPKDDGQAFWTTAANSKLLQDYTWISIATKEGDLEWMIRSAGASILNIHDRLRAKPEKEDFLAWFRQQVLKDREKPFTYCLGLEDSKIRTKLYKEVLPSVLPDLPMVTPNTMAKCICDQRTLTADNGDMLGLLIQSSEGKVSSSVAENTSQPALISAAATTVPQENKPSDLPEMHDESGERSSKKGTTPTLQNENDGHRSSKKRKAENADGNNKVSRQRCATETPPSEPAQISEKTSSRAKDTIDDGQISGKEASPEREEEHIVAPPDEEGSPTKESVADETKETSRKRKEKAPSPPDDDDDNAEDVPPGKRMKLAAVSESGWLQIAPKAKKKRRAYKCSRDEIIKAAGYEEIYEVAVTEHCENLVVADTSTAVQTNPRRRRVTGPDYRAFRKNSIPRVSRVRVELRSVLPRETEQQREYEEQRQALEEQQRRADELFRDPQGRSNSSRSRRR